MTYQKHVCEMLKLAHFLWETHVEIPQKIGREWIIYLLPTRRKITLIEYQYSSPGQKNSVIEINLMK